MFVRSPWQPNSGSWPDKLQAALVSLGPLYLLVHHLQNARRARAFFLGAATAVVAGLRAMLRFRGSMNSLRFQPIPPVTTSLFSVYAKVVPRATPGVHAGQRHGVRFAINLQPSGAQAPQRCLIGLPTNDSFSTKSYIDALVKARRHALELLSILA